MKDMYKIRNSVILKSPIDLSLKQFNKISNFLHCSSSSSQENNEKRREQKKKEEK